MRLVQDLDIQFSHKSGLICLVAFVQNIPLNQKRRNLQVPRQKREPEHFALYCSFMSQWGSLHSFRSDGKGMWLRQQHEASGDEFWCAEMLVGTGEPMVCAAPAGSIICPCKNEP